MTDANDILCPEFIGDSIRADYRTVPKDIRVGVYILQQGRFVFVNQAVCRILRIASSDRLKGQSLWQWVYPDDINRVRIGRGQQRPPLDDGDAFRMMTGDGATVWVAMRGCNTTYRGQRANIGYFIDMSAIRYLGNALKKYRARITHLDDIIFETDLNGTIVDHTGPVHRLREIFDHDIIGKNFMNLLAPHWAEKIETAYRRVYETGEPAGSVIFEIQCKNGRRMVLEDSVALIRDRRGRPTGFRSVRRDISRLKEAERTSEEHHARLLAIFRSVQDGIITIDPALTVVDANDAVKTICGLDPAEAAGQPLAPQLRHCSGACVAILRRTLEERKSIRDFRIECRHDRSRRQIVNVSSSALLDPEGAFAGAVLVLRDVSRLRDLERELHPISRFHGLIGKSKRMQAIYLLLEDLAEVETTVLVTGESGTGKEVVARALHAGGTRAVRPFVAVNCSALAETLLESELFGHVKGAFTGAIADKQGRFEAAHGGTLLLDEIGDLPPRIQLKLLRVLQEKEIERVGEAVPRKVDVRIIACTNKDLRQEIAAGRFREDLYYRLKVVEISIPVLNERMEDVPLLADHFREAFNRQFNRGITGISTEAMSCLMGYHWPGNVRELEHAIERAFILSQGPVIQPADLPPEIHRGKFVPLIPAAPRLLKDSVDRDAVLAALHKTRWNKSKAAKLLRISRPTLYKKIKAYELFESK